MNKVAPLLDLVKTYSGRSLLLLCSLAFLLPYPMIWANIVVALGFINLIVSFFIRRGELEFDFLKQEKFYLIASLYLLEIIGLIYTENFSMASFQLEKRASLLAIPLFVFPTNLTSKQYKTILYCFVSGCLSVLCYCYTKSTIYYFTGNQAFSKWWSTEGLFTLDLLKHTQLHHAQFGMYLIFTAQILLFRPIVKFKSYCYALSILLFCATFLISAKMATAAGFLSCSIAFILFSKNTVLTLLKVVATLLIFSVFIYWSYHHFAGVRSRLSQITVMVEKYESHSIDNNHYEYYNERLVPFFCSLELSREEWPTGFGTGDNQDALNNCYKGMGLTAYQDYDSHNQYFEYLLRFGIIGLLIFLVALFYPLGEFFVNKSDLELALVLLLVFCFITESQLNVNKGILFFALFYSLAIKNKNI